MKCSKCGVEIKKGKSFCGKCGNKIEAKPQAQSNQSQSSPQPAIPKKKKSTGVKILLGCLVIFVVLLIAAGIVGYILVKKGLNVAKDEINKAQDGWTENINGLDELQQKSEEELKNKQDEIKNNLEDKLDDTLNNSTTDQETTGSTPTQKPSEVVEEFMSCTLGTIPQQCPAGDKDSVAKDHLTINMKVDYNSDGFVPLNYCIQQGPDDVMISSEIEAGGFAYVMVDAKYGTDDFQPFWNFILVQQDGEWKIKEIQCLNF